MYEGDDADDADDEGDALGGGAEPAPFAANPRGLPSRFMVGDLRQRPRALTAALRHAAQRQQPAYRLIRPLVITPGPPLGTYRLRVPASRVGYVPEAQGGLPPGPRVLYVLGTRTSDGRTVAPRTVAPQAAASSTGARRAAR